MCHRELSCLLLKCKVLKTRSTSSALLVSFIFICIVIICWPFVLTKRNIVHSSLINVALNILMMSKVHHLLFFRHGEAADNTFQNHASGEFLYLYSYQLKLQFTLFFPSLLFFLSLFFSFFPLSLSFSLCFHTIVYSLTEGISRSKDNVFSVYRMKAF